MRLGVILPNWVGDVVMATPALRALRKQMADNGRLIGIMRPYVADVLAGNPWLDEVVLYEKTPTRLGFSRSVLRQPLRELELDTVLLLTNSLRTAWMAWRSGARRRVGYIGNFRGWLLSDPLLEPRRCDAGGTGDSGRVVRPSPIDSYLHLAYACGCSRESRRLELATTAADEQAADAVWRQLGLPPGERVIVLNSGGAFGGAKHWPAEHFAALAARLATEHGLSVLVNCGPAERDLARSIAAWAGSSRVVSLADVPELPIGLTKACIRRSRLLVTTDSGPRFFAVAFGRPVITMFGPTDAESTPTHYDHETCLSLGIDCQPCWQRTCPLIHHRCMRELSVDQVYSAVAHYLEMPLAA